METPAGPSHRRAWKEESPTLCWLRSGQKEREASLRKTGPFTPSVGGPRVSASSKGKQRQRRLRSIDTSSVKAKRWRGGSVAAASTTETPASKEHIYCDNLVDTPSSSSSVSSASPAPQLPPLDSSVSSSARRCAAPAAPTPRSAHCPNRPLSIKQRKTLLIDRFEHRVSNESISSKWRGYWVFMTITAALSAIYRIMDANQYFTTDPIPGVPQGLYVCYNICTWIVPSLPLGHLVLSTLWKLPKGTCRRVRLFPVKKAPVACKGTTDGYAPQRANMFVIFTERLVTIVTMAVLLPCWIVVGETLFALKLFAVGPVAERWWGVLSIFGVPCVSSTTARAHLRSRKLKVEDFNLRPDGDNSHAGGATPKGVVSVAQILASANHRRKRIAASTPETDCPIEDKTSDGLDSAKQTAVVVRSSPTSLPSLLRRWTKFFRKLFVLEMPRFDLNVDAETLNRMVMLELLLKYIPQWTLQFWITTIVYLQAKHMSFTEDVLSAGQGWNYGSVFSACASFASLSYSASNMMHMWKENLWASTIPDLEELWTGFVSKFWSGSHGQEGVAERSVGAAEADTVEELPSRRSKMAEDGLMATPSIGRSNQVWRKLARNAADRQSGSLRKMVLSNKIRKPLGSLLVNEMTPALRNSRAEEIVKGRKRARSAADSRNRSRIKSMKSLAEAAAMSAHKRRQKMQ